MSIILMLRLSVMLVLAVGGWQLGRALPEWLPMGALPGGVGYYPWFIAAVGAVVGFVSAPAVTVIPYRAMRARLLHMPARALLMGVVGLLIGLVIAALLALPLSLLPGLLGEVLPFVAAVVLASVAATTMVLRDRDILALLGLFVSRDAVRRKRSVVLLDTSVIIDGRIADICQAGFIQGTMLVPHVVLDELQHIADSPDLLRRNRGRRGLEILNRLQKEEGAPLEISEMDVPEIRDVDGKLVRLAQELDCPIITNDYNLNRVAELQGVRVLNINELANAVKVVVLPGETLSVRVIQEGKEAGQGVGYLDDGTMIVVEDGRRHMDTDVDIVVTRVLQTVAGRMIFGQPQNGRR
jgi:uncharacterized protein YacL